MIKRRVLRSALSTKDLMERLDSILEPEKFIRFRKGDKKFEGSRDENSFEIRQIVVNRRSTTAEVSGKVFDKGDYRMIDLRFRMDTNSKIFFSVWFGLVCCFMVLPIVDSIQSKAVSSDFNYLSGMVLFGLVMLLYSVLLYRAEAIRAKNELMTLFEARDEPVELVTAMDENS